MCASSEIYSKFSAGPRMLSSQRRGASRLRYRYTSIASIRHRAKRISHHISISIQACENVYYICMCVRPHVHVTVPWRMYHQATHMSFPYSLIRIQRIGAEGFSSPPRPPSR